MRGDITSLVQSVNLICAKKVNCSNRPKYFFLCVNSRITSNIFKTCFGQSEQVWTDEKLVTILRFEIQSSAFVFLKSLNLSPHNSKSLENSYSITCRVRRKVIRKGVSNVTKNGKALLAKIHEICGE